MKIFMTSHDAKLKEKYLNSIITPDELAKGQPIKNQWKQIWNNKTSKLEENILDSLIESVGWKEFNTSSDRINQKNWAKYVNDFSKKASIEKTDSLFEVGCGAGAFLYPFYLMSHRVSGIDYSKNLVEMARRAMPEMFFKDLDAHNIDINIKYDILIANSVFQYFSNLSYAEIVLDRMIKKAKKKVAILDVNYKKKEAEAYRQRKDSMSHNEYNIRYKGLNHLFYSKEWFHRIAKKNNCHLDIYNQNIKGYLNNSYRFNVVINKIASAIRIK